VHLSENDSIMTGKNMTYSSGSLTNDYTTAEKNSVLVVDDEKSNIMILTAILSEEYTVYAAKSGKDAVEVAKKYLPDVILLDILMPDMDGHQVLSLLKSREETYQIPVILVTGLSEPDEEEKGLRMGAADYIRKPFSPAIIKLRVFNQIQMRNQLNIIRKLSMTDQLTGVPNRRNFDYRINLEWSHARRNKMPLSVFFVDIDHFKKYNDRFGHIQGDVAIQTVAKAIILSLKRPNDFTARWGGEEFVVLLPATPEAGVLEVAEIIRKNINDTSIAGTDPDAKNVTVSIGTNTIIPERESLMESFLSNADSALYNAKKAGRNRVCKYTPNPAVEV